MGADDAADLGDLYVLSQAGIEQYQGEIQA